MDGDTTVKQTNKPTKEKHMTITNKDKLFSFSSQNSKIQEIEQDHQPITINTNLATLKCALYTDPYVALT